MIANPRAPEAAAALRAVVDNVERVLLGKREAIELLLVGLLCEGHVLLEDVPGTGKTTLARALARSVDARFRRIQFTSDLLPADVLGCSMPRREHDHAGGVAAALEFRPGPIFGNLVLADELNRTTPRTQSALLECMTEFQASVEGTTHLLPRPFLVVATQNPLEFEGTYPLPESQLDRFLLRLRLGYPGREHERALLAAGGTRTRVDDLEPVLGLTELRALQAEVPRVRVDAALVEWVLEVLERTRESGRFLLGASTRAGLGLVRAARALALVEGRDYCVPDDVKRLVGPVLGHRLVPLAEGPGRASAEELVRELAGEVPAPT